MRSTPLPFAALLAATVAASALEASCDGHSCTEVGCTDGVTISDLTIGRTVDALDDGRVRVCRDGDCVEDVVTYELPDGDKTGGFISCGQPALRSPFTCARTIRGGVFVNDAIDVSFVGYSSEKPPREGEVFLVEVRTKDGAVVASRTGAVHYEKLEPNGPECAPTCFQSTLK